MGRITGTLILLISINAALCELSPNVEHPSIVESEISQHKNGISGLQKRQTGGVSQGKRRGIIRPCPDMNMDCIRDFFARNSQCSRAEGRVPRTVYRAQSNMNYPALNLTVIQTEVRYRFVDPVVVDFYINTDTDETLLAVEFKDVRCNAPNSYFRYYRPRKEPVVTKGPTSGFTGQTTTSTVFQGTDHLDLRRSETTWYIDGPVGVSFDPKLGDYPDPSVAESFAAAVKNVNKGWLVVTLPPWVASTYIQHTICNFNLHLL